MNSVNGLCNDVSPNKISFDKHSPFTDRTPLPSRNTISDQNSHIRFVYQYQSSSRSNGSSQRSTNIEWKRYSIQRLNMSKSRLTGQEDGTRYHPLSCASKISPHTSSR